MVKVYSKPGCPQCSMSYKLLEQLGISYNKIDITQDEDGYNRVISLGYQSLPVFEVNGNHWNGFDPDAIKSLAA